MSKRTDKLEKLIDEVIDKIDVDNSNLYDKARSLNELSEAYNKLKSIEVLLESPSEPFVMPPIEVAGFGRREN